MRKKLNNWKLKKKLNFGYNVALILMLLSAIISVVGLVGVYLSLDNYVNNVQKADVAVKACRIDVNIAARNIREMSVYSSMDETSKAELKAQGVDTNYREIVDEKTADIETWLADLKSTTALDAELVSKYETALTEWEKVGYQILDLLDEGTEESILEADYLILTACAPKLTEVIDIAKEMDAVTNTAKTEAAFSSQVITYVAGTLVIAFVIITFIVSKAIGNMIVKSILTPVHQIQNVVEGLSEGDLHRTLEYHSEDELGQLSDKLRSSFAILTSYIEDLSRAMSEFAKGNFDVQPEVEWKGDFIGILKAALAFEESMAKTVAGIQRVAGQVAGGSEQVAASSMDLAQGATDQAGVTEELTATIENVAEQVAMNAESAKEISKKVADVADEVNSCDQKMHEMVSAMSEINSASREISKIIATINDIASQTNLLALNASIEAARAGEAGKGFAVVADQVSVLASQSADAAKESTGLIETSVKSVERGMVIADEAADQLKNVVSGAQVASEEVSRVAAALEEQADSMNQINEGVGQINDVVQTNSATSEETAAASQEMSGQAETLKDLIRQFKVQEYEE